MHMRPAEMFQSCRDTIILGANYTMPEPTSRVVDRIRLSPFMHEAWAQKAVRGVLHHVNRQQPRRAWRY